MFTARLLTAGAVALLTACLAQAVSLSLPWCAKVDARHTAISTDQHWILAKDSAQPSLTLYDNTLKPVRHFSLKDVEGKPHSTVLTLVDAPGRESFIVVMRDMPEIWEISYNPNAEPIFDGLVHDYRMGEGLARPGFLGLRRTLLRTPLAEPYFTADYSTVIGLAHHADSGDVKVRVVNLDVRKEIATGTLATLPEQGAPFAVTANGRTWRANRSQTPATESVQKLMRYCTP